MPPHAQVIDTVAELFRVLLKRGEDRARQTGRVGGRPDGWSRARSAIES